MNLDMMFGTNLVSRTKIFCTGLVFKHELLKFLKAIAISELESYINFWS